VAVTKVRKAIPWLLCSSVIIVAASACSLDLKSLDITTSSAHDGAAGVMSDGSKTGDEPTLSSDAGKGLGVGGVAGGAGDAAGSGGGGSMSDAGPGVAGNGGAMGGSGGAGGGVQRDAPLDEVADSASGGQGGAGTGGSQTGVGGAAGQGGAGIGQGGTAGQGAAGQGGGAGGQAGTAGQGGATGQGGAAGQGGTAGQGGAGGEAGAGGQAGTAGQGGGSGGATGTGGTTAPSTVKLTGTTFGSGPPYDNNQTVGYAKAFDGLTNTYFDDSNATGGYTGIDLGPTGTASVTLIRFYPRTAWGFAQRMLAGKFQCSMTSQIDGYTDLYTIPTTPPPAWTEVAVTSSPKCRYLRYLSPEGGYTNVAEIEFWGVR
jgi:hypothetical protein